MISCFFEKILKKLRQQKHDFLQTISSKVVLRHISFLYQIDDNFPLYIPTLYDFV